MPNRSRKTRRRNVAVVDNSETKQSSVSGGAPKPRLEGAERALKAATIFLSSVDDFRFCAAVFGNPVRRDYWIGRLTENLTARKTELSVLDFAPLKGVRLLQGLRDHLSRTSAREGWRHVVTVTGLEAHLPDPIAPTGPERLTNRFLAEANLDRELFPRYCPVAILVWLTPTGVGSFARDAPDLWHWRSHVFDFEEALSSDATTTLGISELERAGAGTVYRNQQEMQRAAAVFSEGLKAATRAHGSSHPRAREARANLANVIRQLGDYKRAEKLFRENLAALEARSDQNPAEVSMALNSLGTTLQDIGKFQEAESLLRRALEINEKHFGKDAWQVALGLNNLARTLWDRGQLAEAEKLMRQALEIDEKKLRPDPPTLAVHLNNLAQVLIDNNKSAEAEPLLRRALEITEKSFGQNDPRTATRLNNLGWLMHSTNRSTEAEPLVRRALEIDEKNFGTNHPVVATRLNNVALLMQAAGRLEEAEPLMRRALQILLASTVQADHPHPNLEVGKKNYTDLLKQMGKSDDQVKTEIAKLERDAKKMGKF